MAKSWKKASIATASALALILILVPVLRSTFASPREPSYRGVSLQTWLEVLHNPSSTPTLRQEAISAIQAMGTNVIPSLLDAVGKPDSSVLSRFVAFGNRLGLKHQLPMHKAWSSAGLLRLSASRLDAPTRLEAAKVLFEASIKLNRSGVDGERRFRDLAFTLTGLGESAYELFAASLTNSEAEVRIHAATLIGYRGDAPTNLIPALGNCLTDTNEMVRRRAVSSLGHFRNHGPMVVPLLTPSLADRDELVRVSAVDGLVHLGRQAEGAIPDLVQAAKREPRHRPVVLEYIRSFDPGEVDRVPKALAEWK